MHPSLAHDVVEQRMKQRLDEAQASRLGRRRRDRRHGRSAQAPAEAVAPEPKLRRLILVAPRPT